MVHQGKIRAAIALIPIAAVVVGCSNSARTATSSSPATTASHVVDVVAGENFWGNIVEQIGGDRVKVTSIISDPNADPHIYESDPKDAAAIAGAQLVIENGLGYDDFMAKLLSASKKSSRQVLSVQQVLAIKGDNPNPNAKTFDASLQPLLATIAEIKSRYAGTSISYTERVPGYLVQAAGLVLGTPASFSQSIEDGNDPNPLDTATFDADITGHKVKVLLYNSQVTDQQTTKIKALATSAGIPIVGVSETLPPSDANFQAWQLRQDNALLAALGR
jgi:zinc/manganese transport system substrate-binding protein